MTLYLILLLLALQLADAWTTVRGMSSGRTHETNPLLVRLATVLPGRWTWLVLSTAVVFGLLAWVWTLPYDDHIAAALVIVALFYAYIVWNNWKLINKE